MENENAKRENDEKILQDLKDEKKKNPENFPDPEEISQEEHMEKLRSTIRLLLKARRRESEENKKLVSENESLRRRIFRLETDLSKFETESEE